MKAEAVRFVEFRGSERLQRSDHDRTFRIFPDPRKLLSVAEIADALSVTARTVRKWIEAGELPAHRIGKHEIRCFAGDAENMMNPYQKKPAK